MMTIVASRLVANLTAVTCLKVINRLIAMPCRILFRVAKEIARG